MLADFGVGADVIDNIRHVIGSSGNIIEVSTGFLDAAVVGDARLEELGAGQQRLEIENLVNPSVNKLQ